MAVNTNALGDAMLAAIDAEPAFGEAPHGGETFAAYRKRLKRAEAAAMWGYISANARVTVNPTGALDVIPACTAGGVVAPATVSTSDTVGTIA